MSGQDDIKRLIINYQRRLQKLKETQALQGINTPPDILIQIEDIEAELEKFQIALKTLAPDAHPESLHSSSLDPNTLPNLIQQLLSALKEDPNFAAELAGLLNPTPAEQVSKTSSVTASGVNIAVSGNVSGGIIFGNNNTITDNNAQTEKD